MCGLLPIPPPPLQTSYQPPFLHKEKDMIMVTALHRNGEVSEHSSVESAILYYLLITHEASMLMPTPAPDRPMLSLYRTAHIDRSRIDQLYLLPTAPQRTLSCRILYIGDSPTAERLPPMTLELSCGEDTSSHDIDPSSPYDILLSLDMSSPILTFLS